jgi:hypothetical protein
VPIKYVEVTETVHIRKTVKIAVIDHNIPDCHLEMPAMMSAFQELPDYEAAGWELVGSEGCTFQILENQNGGD